MSGRETTAPGDQLFKKYKNKHDTIKDKIDSGSPNTFKWPQVEDSFVYRKAKEILTRSEWFWVTVLKSKIHMSPRSRGHW